MIKTNFKDYFLDLREKVLLPKGLDITTNDPDVLNDWYEEFGFNFEEVDDPRQSTHGGYNPATGEITIYVNPMKTSVRQLDTLVNHEIIHKMQDELSKGAMGKQNIKKYDDLKEIERKLYILEKNNEKKSKKYKELHKKWKKMIDDIKYYNPEEMMTYTYMLTRDRKDHNLKSPQDVAEYLINWLKIKDKKLIRKLKNYSHQYWMLKDKL